MKRDFLTLADLTKDEIQGLLAAAARLKADRSAGRRTNGLTGRTVGMIFHKPSTRTRVSFEVGVYELGGRVVYMQDVEIQLSRREPISHAARVLSRYLDALVIRTYSHEEMEEMAQYASIPVINALTDKYHPCQVLSDLMTIVEKKGRLEGLKVAWIGDGNNMANSWINAAAIMGFELALATPEGYEPDAGILAKARDTGRAVISLTTDPFEAAAGADVINTDVWASMGWEAEAQERAEKFRSFQVNADLVSRAASGALVMHCLPAHLGDEITEEVLEGPQSVVFDQAENRLHAQKALLRFVMCGSLD